ncbi:unnamed protein product [Rhizoctonia solani]|uniref:Uncharacterized protein n=1 Tax=Rhizoctonia solani TaxID=456999 RepID=A0A8H3BR71_9AGAM|nr:unnamed protein product [Rhizoctonia solani]
MLVVNKLAKEELFGAHMFITTFLCLVVAVGLFMWVSMDFDRVTRNPVAHAVAILLSDSILPVIGIIINVLIIVRMTGKAETTGSQSSQPQGSQHTHLRSPSNAHADIEQRPPHSRSNFEVEKPIPLRIISTHQTTSDVELGIPYKAKVSNSVDHSVEDFGIDKHNPL